jgi:PAS domain S-box-containing protein
MPYQFTFSMLPLFIAALISGALAWYTWRHRNTQAAKPFVVLMLVLLQWELSYILQVAATDLPTKLFWDKITFLGVVAMPVAWLVFAVEFIGRKSWINTLRLAMLSILPLTTTIIIWTTASTGFFRGGFSLVEEGPFLLLKTTNGTWFWVHAAYSYILIMIGLVMLVQALLRWPAHYRAQMLVVLVSTLTPLIANILTIFKIVSTEIDLTPFAFTVTGVGMAYAMFRHRLLDIAPVARDVVINGMRDGVIILDSDRRIVDLNPAAQQIVARLGNREPIGISIVDFFSPWPELIERYQRVEEDYAEDEITRGEGDLQRWYELNLSTLRNENQHFVGQVIMIHEITGRKRTEKQLSESEARFRQIVENASDMIYRVDMNGCFTYANPSALHVMGFEREEELLGTYYLDMTTPEARHKLKRTYLHQLVSKTQNTYHEFPAIAKDGSEIWFGQNVQLIYEGDQIIGFQCLARNVTAIKQAQDALRIARDQALEASRAKSQLLSKVSHELRTPLGGILGYSELLRDDMFGELNAEQKRVTNEIMDSANFLNTMVNELLDEAQMQSNTLSLREQQFSPAALLKSSTSGMEALARKKGLLFSAVIDEKLPAELYGDDHRLRQIVINLIGNAIKFTKQGHVQIAFQCTDQNHWQIRVADSGVGIAREAQEYIFDPFRQVSESMTDDNRGIGLGLAITSQLVQLMNGNILLESETGKGTTFTIVLPIKTKMGEPS